MGIDIKKIDTRMMVVDDEPDSANLIAGIARLSGIATVDVFTSPSDALDALEGATYSIASIDVAMPEMDGYDLALEMRRVSPATQIVIVSGLPSFREAARFLNGGSAAVATHYFQKPLVVQEFGEAIRRLAYPSMHGYALIGTRVVSVSKSEPDTSVELSDRQAFVVELIMRSGGSPVSINEIVAEIEAKYGHSITLSATRTHIHRVREHLEAGTRLRIVHDGKGYALVKA